MLYDPIKNIFADTIRKHQSLRVLFYKTLDLMFLRSWYVRKELREIRKSFGNKIINILDAGTGFGQYTYFMSTKLQPNKILAIDVKEDWIDDCKNFFQTKNFQNIKFDVQDLIKINYKNEFDLIVCVDVMEHIEDDITVFQNFYNALKEDGFLLINTPSIYGGSDVHNHSEESFIGEHARVGYSTDELNKKLLPLGFKFYKAIYTYGFWGDKAWRLGIKYPMILLNISKLFLIILPFYYLLTLPFTLLMMNMDINIHNKTGSGITYIVKK